MVIVMLCLAVVIIGVGAFYDFKDKNDPEFLVDMVIIGLFIFAIISLMYGGK